MHTASLPVLWDRMISLFQLIFLNFIPFVGKVNCSANEFTHCMVTMWNAARGAQIWTSSERYLSHDKSCVLFAIWSHCFVCFKGRTLRTDDKWAVYIEFRVGLEPEIELDSIYEPVRIAIACVRNFHCS